MKIDVVKSEIKSSDIEVYIYKRVMVCAQAVAIT